MTTGEQPPSLPPGDAEVKLPTEEERTAALLAADITEVLHHPAFSAIGEVSMDEVGMEPVSFHAQQMVLGYKLTQGALNNQAPLSPSLVAADQAEQERMRQINAIPVPEDTTVSPHIYQHMAYHAAHNREVLLRFVRYRMRDSGVIDADDVVQETFLETIRYAEQRGEEFKNSEAGIKLLFGTARYQILGARSRIKRKSDRENLFDEMPAYADGAEEDMDVQTLDALFGNDIALAIGHGLGYLTRQRQRVFDYLLENPDSTAEEAGKALGMTAETYRTTKSAMAKIVRERLEERLKREGLLARDKLAFDLIGDPIPDKPKPKAESLTALSSRTLRTASAFREAGENNLAPIIPHYVGQWAIAVQDIRAHLKQTKGSALVVYPHETSIRAFTDYIEGVLGDQAQDVGILTPGQIIPDYLERGFFDYVALTEGIPARLREQLRTRAGFMLRLLAEEPAGLVGNVYTLPTYAEAGGAYIDWRPHNSVRYLKEWRFATGTQMTEEDVERMASQGQGPGLRRLCQGIGSFMAVQAEAGYSFGTAAETKKKKE